MTYDWVVHAATFFILVSYRGRDAHYRAVVSVIAALMAGLSLALTFYALNFELNTFVTFIGLIVLTALARCRGNVAKLLPAKKPRPTNALPKRSH